MVLFRRVFYVGAIVTLLVAAVAASQASEQPRGTVSKEQQNEASAARTEPQQTAPIPVTIDNTVRVVSQPDPTQAQRDAESKAEARFDNIVDVVTLVFAGLAALAAYGAYRANLRSATAAETQIAVLKTQLATATSDAAEQKRSQWTRWPKLERRLTPLNTRCSMRTGPSWSFVTSL